VKTWDQGGRFVPRRLGAPDIRQGIYRAVVSFASRRRRIGANMVGGRTRTQKCLPGPSTNYLFYLRYRDNSHPLSQSSPAETARV